VRLPGAALLLPSPLLLPRSRLLLRALGLRLLAGLLGLLRTLLLGLLSPLLLGLLRTLLLLLWLSPLLFGLALLLSLCSVLRLQGHHHHSGKK
jgi:hypothetical protein